MKKLVAIIVSVLPFSFCAGAHPKLFFSSADIPALKQEVNQPAYIATWQSIKQTADNYCDSKSSQYLDPSSSFFADYSNAWYGRDLEGYLEILGFAYQMTGNSKYGLKGAAILDKAVNYVAPSTCITQPYNMEMPRSYSVGYDWLYAAMTAQQRSRVEALAPTYINWSLQASVPGWGRPYHNYNGVGYGAMGLFALATEDIYPNDFPNWLTNIQQRLNDWFNYGFDAQGSYGEGFDYMQYGFSNGLAFADALQRNKGINLFNNVNLQMVPRYLAQIRLPGESTYEPRNDAYPKHYFDVSMLRLAGAENSPLMEYMWQQGLAYCPTADDYHKGGYSPMRILWESNIAPQTPTSSGEPLAQYFQGTGLVTFRSGWDKQNSLFTIQARPIFAGTHDQADKGHFGFYSLGYRWAADSQYGNNRDTNGRCQTVAHSCILIDNAGQALTGSSYETNGKILKYENHDNYGYALADSTDAYNTDDHGIAGPGADHALRHTVYVRESGTKPAYAVIIDDIKKKDSGNHNFTWQMISWHNMDVELGGANPLVIPIEYVETPVGSSGTGTCSWTVNVATAGTYELWARVRANGATTSSSDSFNIQMDSGSQIYWSFPQATDGMDAAGSLGWVWGWGKVVDSGNGGAAVTFSLSAGSHVIKFKTRETGAQIAAAFLTNKVGQTPKYTDSTQGFVLKAKTATVTAPMVFRPRDSQMEIVMDANSTPQFSYDFYEPGDGRTPATLPRFKANCTAAAPKFITVLIPHSTSAVKPAVSFQTTINGKIIDVTWPDRRDEIAWYGSNVSVDINTCKFDIVGDLNQDCTVDMIDLAILGQSWMICTDSNSPNCKSQIDQDTSGVLTDDYSTIALWHMDSISGAKVIDDCSATPNRHNDLILYNNPVVAGSMANFTNALSLNGTTQYGTALTNWASQNSVTIDLWYNTSIASGTQELVTAIDTWNIQLSDSDVQMDMWDSDGTAHSIFVRSCVQPDTWQHVTATVDTLGNMILTVDGYTPATLSAGKPMKLQNAAIDIGNKPPYARYFTGLIDEIKITVPSTLIPPCAYFVSDLNGDCHVDAKDLGTVAQNWLACSAPGIPDCTQP